MDLNVENRVYYVRDDLIYLDVLECKDWCVLLVIEHYRKKINSGYAIKCNWLFFTLCDTKFKIHVSNFSEEYLFIRQIIRRLGLLGCNTFYYCGGIVD